MAFSAAMRRHVHVLIRALLIFILAGCTTEQTSGKLTQDKVQLLWPSPPEQPRFIYETSLSSAADIVKETDEERIKRVLTGQTNITDKPVYDKPSGVAARHGRVYVADPASRAIIVFDAARRRLFSFGWREPNALQRPVSIAVDHQDKVYVLDGRSKRVMVFDDMGLFLFTVGDPKAFTSPAGVAVSPDGERIYIVDRGTLESDDHKVVVYAPDGKERYRIGTRGAEAGKFNIPLAAAVGADGSLYVADTGNFRVQVFDAEGKFRFEFGGVGANPGKFSRARSIALDGDGNIYVSDGGFNNVQIFDPTGQLLMPLGRLERKPGPGHYALIAGIAVDETNRLYVIDHYFKKIDVFRRLTDEEGQQLASK
jgi:DNA-binding beta-propeller fold protein YncE